MSIYLRELPVAERDDGFEAFHRLPEIEQLGWPVEVVEQWLFDHGHHPAFLVDYQDVNLGAIQWNLEPVSLTELAVISTGPSEQSFLDEVATDHIHYTSKRSAPIQKGWTEHGTWLVPPVVLDRQLLGKNAPGLQLVEGRMRTGILQGRFRAGLWVASAHQAWVGRPE